MISKKATRTQNVIRNICVGELAQVITLILNFVNRTIFIRILSADYLGINGLFTNVLTVLSFAELGLGSITGFYLYKPLANGNIEDIRKYIVFYKKAYRIIASTVMILGIGIMPFLPLIIQDNPPIRENLNVIYILFLANTVASYFNVYKKVLLQADQKEYITLICHRIVSFMQLVLQSVFLFLTREYIVFLLIQIVCTVIDNFVTGKVAFKLYPFLKSNEAVVQLNKDEKRQFLGNIRAVAIKKFGEIILNGTDNIVISAILNLTTVGLYSNYTMIVNAVGLITSQITNALTASVGNLNAVVNKEKKEEVFNQIFLVTAVIFGFCVLEIYFLINPFIELWIGKEFILSPICLIAIVCNIYVMNMSHATYSFRYTSGYFKEFQMTPVYAACLNLVLSIFLGEYLKLFGILIATSISRLLTYFWVDPVIVYKNIFHKSSKRYFFRYAMFALLNVLIGIVLDFIWKQIPSPDSFFMWGLYAIGNGLLILGVYFIVLIQIEDGKKLMERFRMLLKRKNIK